MGDLGETGNAVLQTIQASEGGRALRLLKQRQQMRERLQEAKDQIESKGLKRRNLTFGGSAADRLEEEFKKETIGLVTVQAFKEKRAKLEEQLRIEQRNLFPQKYHEKRRMELRLVTSKLSFGSEESVDEVLTQSLSSKVLPAGGGGEETAGAASASSPRGGRTSTVSSVSSSPSPVLVAKSALSDIDSESKKETSLHQEADKLKKEEKRCNGESSIEISIKIEEEEEKESERGPTQEGDVKEEEENKKNMPENHEHTSLAVDSLGFQRRRRRIGKDPTVDTDFLPDEERDAKVLAERKRLIEEYHQMEEKAKQERLWVTYSFWDGTGHRRRTCVKKGNSVLEFLEQARNELEQEFVELRGIHAVDLMYVKEDLILPHSVTFYDLIKTKARGKSGPLFTFNVHEDIRQTNDSRLEKVDSHAGKVVERKWFERNKHIFPASRWEVYNPNKVYDSYTIHGGVHKWRGVSNSEIRDAIH